MTCTHSVWLKGHLSAVLPYVAAGAAVLGILQVEPLLAASADVQQGKALFEQCTACHSLDAAPSTGPSLKGVFGRTAGTRDDYRYSPAMQRSGIVWNAGTLDAYLADPQGVVKGTRMAFAGIADKAERAALIAYLEQATQ